MSHGINKVAILDVPITDTTIWKVRLDCENPYVDIGVSISKSNNLDGNAKRKGSWSIFSRNGCAYQPNNDKGTRFTTQFNENDTITVRVDVNQGKASVKYFRNNTDLGGAFKNLDTPIYPYFMFTAKDVKVTIVD